MKDLKDELKVKDELKAPEQAFAPIIPGPVPKWRRPVSEFL